MSKQGLFACEYGHFGADGKSYVVTRPDTPKPWINMVANERYGFVISQAGGGFSWIDHSALSVLTRWEMDLVRDAWGKWIYLRDEDSGAVWSASPQPTMAPLQSYRCTHGLGYSRFDLQAHDIASQWTLTVPCNATHETWKLTLRNCGDNARRLTVCSHLWWCLGAAPDAKREFHRLFIDSQFDQAEGLITARKNLWDVPHRRYGHWNTEWPEVAFHATWFADRVVGDAVAACGDHQAFLGRHGNWAQPAWLATPEHATCGFNRHNDAIAALAVPILLEPEGECSVFFAVGAGPDEARVRSTLQTLRGVSMEEILNDVASDWDERLGGCSVSTPDPAFDLLNNSWLPYQAISARLWGRTGYWQQSGAFGFRDQLQDSQVWLPRKAGPKCAEQVRLHARHQFVDGTVYHWWHPLSEVGLRTQMTDDLLWLPFVVTSCLKETGDYSLLDEREPFVDEEPTATLWDHCVRAIGRVLARFSPRGLPLIGAGDWNDGLSACGLEWRGESVWLGHFLHLVLRDWSYIAAIRGEADLTTELTQRADALRDAINEHGWDSQWYWRASLDDGSLIGSHDCAEGRIFLNAQTWSVIGGTAPAERAAQAMDSVQETLLRDYGPLLLTPAYSKPDKRIGYLTRYAPGARENGGVYTHAACWAIQAEAMLGRAELAWRIFASIAPPNRSRDIERYQVEPYVTPGNIDGPESPVFGRGGWTWYSGSAAWLDRVCKEWILGVRADWDGLIVQPRIPPHWDEARVVRHFRGDAFEILIRNPERVHAHEMVIEVDGHPHDPAQPIVASGQCLNRRVDVSLIPAGEAALAK